MKLIMARGWIMKVDQISEEAETIAEKLKKIASLILTIKMGMDFVKDYNISHTSGNEV